WKNGNGWQNRKMPLSDEGGIFILYKVGHMQQPKPQHVHYFTSGECVGNIAIQGIIIARMC
ncbi:MAG: hypothetical protein D6712_13250, partial [Chloroflexi bacterium]